VFDCDTNLDSGDYEYLYNWYLLKITQINILMYML
jgi:hypothetical protein